MEQLMLFQIPYPHSFGLKTVNNSATGVEITFKGSLNQSLQITQTLLYIVCI